MGRALSLPLESLHFHLGLGTGLVGQVPDLPSENLWSAPPLSGHELLSAEVAPLAPGGSPSVSYLEAAWLLAS
jgi:hypothetical protein